MKITISVKDLEVEQILANHGKDTETPWMEAKQLVKQYAEGCVKKSLLAEGSEVVYQGFTDAELKVAFDRVKNPDDWKARIFARVPTDLIGVTEAAIEYNVGTSPTITMYPKYALVQSLGYRAGPCGDH